MFAQYYCSRRWALPAYGLGLLIIALWLCNAWVDLQMNAWTGRFYDELQAAFSAANSSKALDLEELAEVESSYTSLLRMWLLLSIPKVVVGPLVNWLTRHWAFQWRQAITLDYLYRWRVVSKGRLELESISQRVQDDAYKLTKGIDSLVQGVLIALLQVFTFLPLLWSLTSPLPGLAGHLVAINLGAALSGIAISSVVGRYLITLEYQNQAVEAAFRKELVYAEDGVEGFGLIAVCHRLFYTLRAQYYTLFLHLIYFELWQALFNRCEELIPMLILGDAVYQGNISLGTFMQISRAHHTVTDGLTMLIQRWVEFNELLSVVRRLKELDRTLPPNGGVETELMQPPVDVAGTHAAKESTPLMGYVGSGPRTVVSTRGFPES